MPAKNALKEYLENGYYHLYNRGVEKRPIFLEKQDYSVFLSYLKEYLVPKNIQELREKLTKVTTSWREKSQILKSIQLNNFSGNIILLAFSLLPNHFHLLIKQREQNAIDRFTRSFGTRYTMYFNKKYKRIGPLYQGVYKAVRVLTDEQLLHLSRYIHRQALNLQGDSLQATELQPSSYGEYLGLRKTEWIKPEEILSFFSKTNSRLFYKSFVEQTEDLSLINKLIIED